MAVEFHYSSIRYGNVVTEAHTKTQFCVEMVEQKVI